jgi:hypothetical protein
VTTLVAGLSRLASGGQIYTSDHLDTTTPGSLGYITGAQYEAVELQYVGGGMFSVLSFVGSLRAY